MKSSFRVLIAAALCATLCACATPMRVAGPDTVPVAAPRVGEQWRFREIEGYRAKPLAEITYTVVGTDAGGIDLQVAVDGSPQSGIREGQVVRYVSPWQVAQDAVYDRELVYEPAAPLVGSRRQGSRETVLVRAAAPDGQRPENWFITTSWVGWEEVEVPAGRFRAARFDRLIKFFNNDTFRWSTERRESLWYSPEVGHWVRRQVTGFYLRPPYVRGRRAEIFREDWTIWELLEYRPVSGGTVNVSPTLP